MGYNIFRDDMLELTRRMTPERSSIFRIAGAYVDETGYITGTFNTSMLKLPADERNKNLKLAKTVPFSKTNEELIMHEIPGKGLWDADMYKLLMGLRECELKNDALLDVFYEIMAEHIGFDGPYALFVYFGSYDIPLKASDKEYMRESESVYNYIICTLSPMAGEYEPAAPVKGFLFPGYYGRAADLSSIYVYNKR